MAIWLFRKREIRGASWLALKLLDDLARKDRKNFHKLLWANHVFYAESYEVRERFETDNKIRTRDLFFSSMGRCLEEVGMPPRQVKSVLEVGCSLGYQLRRMETDMFPCAERLLGVDIDEYAITQGNAHLSSLNSKVRLICADMENLDDLVGSDRFDVIFCTGVLMYLNQEAAVAVVKSLLKHTKGILGISGFSNPAHRNSHPECSSIRNWDQSFIHNLESLVSAAGGHVMKVLWDSETQYDENKQCLVFAQSSTPVLRAGSAETISRPTLPCSLPDCHPSSTSR